MMFRMNQTAIQKLSNY